MNRQVKRLRFLSKIDFIDNNLAGEQALVRLQGKYIQLLLLSVVRVKLD